MARPCEIDGVYRNEKIINIIMKETAGVVLAVFCKKRSIFDNLFSGKTLTRRVGCAIINENRRKV